jgi:hypothetical protein
MSWTQIIAASSLGPWLTFAVQTAPPVAALVFIFVLLVASIFVVLLICARDPHRMLPMLLLLGPIAAAYCAIYVCGMIAIAGWPIMQIIERTFGLSSESEARVISFFTLNYISLAIDALGALALVVMLLVGAIWREQTVQHQRAGKKPPELRGAFDQAAGQAYRAEQSLPPVEARREPKGQAGGVGNVYQRIGVVAGLVFSGFVLTTGLVLALTERRLMLILYFGFAAAAVFLATYGSGRLLGWAVDSFFEKAQVEV